MKFTVCFLAIVCSAVAVPEKVPLKTPDKFVGSEETISLSGSRTIDGFQAIPSATPYQVGLTFNTGRVCGGSLIATNAVLTSAQCTIAASSVVARFGVVNINQSTGTEVRVVSENIIVQGSVSDDIALIMLPSDVTLTENIQVVPLAASNAPSYTGSTAVLTGWGTVSHGGLYPYLSSVNLTVISNTACALLYPLHVRSSNVCTAGVGIGNSGDCNADLGSPLVVNGVQIGIASVGLSLCKAGFPAVHVRVSSYRSWIDANL